MLDLLSRLSFRRAIPMRGGLAVLYFNHGPGGHDKTARAGFRRPQQPATASTRRDPPFRQAFLTRAFLIRATATVTIAPVTPPPAALPSAVPISTPLLLAALPRAGIKLCRIVPPRPPPTAPEIVLRRGTQDNILEKASGDISANRPANNLNNEINDCCRHICLLLCASGGAAETGCRG